MTSPTDHLEDRFMDAAVATCAECAMLVGAFCTGGKGCVELDSGRLACSKVDQNHLIIHLPRIRAAIIVMDKIKDELMFPTDERIFYIYDAMEQGMSTEKISELTQINPFFIVKMRNLFDAAKEIGKIGINQVT